MSNSLEAKLVILGSQGVGKTSLVHRYVKNNFAHSIHSTIGASFLTKRVLDVDSSNIVRLQIWDTAGQERFRSISKLYYRGLHIIL
jgi:small GTP-binding protein